jgi:hypothetical protein
MLLNWKLQDDLKELFGYRGVGITEVAKLPLVTFSKEDPDAVEDIPR